MPNPPFESLRKELLRAGVSPRYLRRYSTELSDHYHLAVEQNRSAGMKREEATAEACRQLGDQETLFQSVVEHPAAIAFARRHPSITFMLLPIPALLLIKALIVAIGVLIGLIASRLGMNSVGWMNLAQTTAHILLSYGAPLIVALFYCVLARRRWSKGSWPLLSAALISFVAGCLQLEIQQPLFDMGFVQAGVAEASFVVTPVVLVPLLVWVAFLAVRRQVETAPFA